MNNIKASEFHPLYKLLPRKDNRDIGYHLRGKQDETYLSIIILPVEAIAVRTFSCSNIFKHVFSILSYINIVNIAR